MADSEGLPPEAPALAVKKRFRVWTITDIVGMDRSGWRVIQDSAMWVAGVASAANLTLVVVFACAIASQSVFGLMENAPFWAQAIIWFILMVVATVIAGVLQLCSDFGLAWGAGLATEKYRVSPSVVLFVWAMCVLTTLYMKFDLYSSWAHERQAVVAQAQAENANDARILAKFPAAAPPGLEASQRIINAAPQLVDDLRKERDRLVSARDQERRFLGNTDTGMGPEWRKLNEQVLATNTEITAVETAAATAATAKQDRIDYDAAKQRQESNVKRSANNGATMTLFYDQPFVIFLRVVAGAAVSILGVLVALVARKKREELRLADEAKAKAAERAKKGWRTREERASTFDGDFEEAAPLGAKAIPDLGPTAPGTFAESDSHIRQETDVNTHPDATGDLFSANTKNGHGKEDTDGAQEPGQPTPE